MADSSQLGIDFLLSTGSGLIGGTTSSTLTVSTELQSNPRKDTSRAAPNKPGRRSFEISFDGLFLEGGEEVQAHGSELLVGGSPFPDLTSITLSLSQETSATSSMDDSFWQTSLPSTRSAELSAEGNYRDPASEPTVQSVVQAQRAGEILQAEVAFGSASYALQWAISEYSQEAPIEVSTISVSGAADGLPTRTSTGSPDPGLDALLASFFSASRDPMSVAMRVTSEDGSDLAGATRRTGQVYPTELEISLPDDGPAEVSGTLQGTGALATTEQNTGS